jgi:uncharacterized protein (DUF885 family)
MQPRELAERFHTEWLATHPFAASVYGIPGYDHLVPDDSEQGESSWRERVDAILAEAGEIDQAALGPADAVTLGCLVELAEQEVAALESAAIEHTVTPMPFSGLPTMLAVAARTVLSDGEAAEDYLERLRRSGRWIDQQTDRLRGGAAKGRLPVAPLVESAIAWAGELLSEDVPEPLAAPAPPEGWRRREEWLSERDSVATDIVKPAIQRWAFLLEELLGKARPPEKAGLGYLPGGEADYERAVRTHTTLPLRPEEIHRTGLEQLELTEERAAQIGETLGLADLEETRRALAGSAEGADPKQAMAAALRAVRRAEERVGGYFPSPLPPPCEVTAMPPVVASSGVAPHYTPPRLDGKRPGTYWFNTERATAGTGWDLESVAFHEAVPGHHLQLSRIQMLSELPPMQRQRSVTVFSEGWGLYAEQLAEEMGLYSDPRGVLGSLTASMMRAARLVIDTGIHAFGWSRERAVRFFTAHVPMPAEYLEAEVDRYIIMPGQALSYLTGKLEILRLREECAERAGDAFSLAEFHGALLDSGSLPIPVLRRSIASWLEGGGR